jgi:hypothetical protein
MITIEKKKQDIVSHKKNGRNAGETSWHSGPPYLKLKCILTTSN